MVKRKASVSRTSRETSRVKRSKQLLETSTSSSGDELEWLSDHEFQKLGEEFVPSTTSDSEEYTSDSPGSSDVEMEVVSDHELNLIRVSEDLSEPPEMEIISAWTADKQPLNRANVAPVTPEARSPRKQEPEVPTEPTRERSKRVVEREQRLLEEKKLLEEERRLQLEEMQRLEAERQRKLAENKERQTMDSFWNPADFVISDKPRYDAVGNMTAPPQAEMLPAPKQKSLTIRNQGHEIMKSPVLMPMKPAPRSRAGRPVRTAFHQRARMTAKQYFDMDYVPGEDIDIPSDGSEYEPDSVHRQKWDGRARQFATEWMTLRPTKVFRSRAGKRIYGILPPGEVLLAINVGRTWVEFELKNKRAGSIRGGHIQIHYVTPQGNKELNVCPRSEAHLHNRKKKANMLYIQDGNSPEPEILVNEGFPELNRFGLNANRPGLKDYQQEGVRWMSERERFDRRNPGKVLGGILADEMGLGKTVQTITTMVHNAHGPTMIVVPVSILQQWKDEIDSWTGGRFYVHLFHGPREAHSRAITWEDDYDPQYGIMDRGFEYWGTMYDRAFYARTTLRCMEKLNLPGVERSELDPVCNLIGQFAGVNTGVMLTTYGVLQQELKADNNRGGRNSPLFHLVRDGQTERVAWHRIIGDEMHKIRNHNTDLAKIFSPQETGWLKGAKVRRWVLSGTPLQNKPEELYSYLRYLQWKDPEYGNMPDFLSFCHDLHIRQGAKTLEGKSLGSYTINRIKDILYPPHEEPLLMRRTKKELQVDDQLELLEIDEKIIIIEMTPEEQQFYDQVEKKVTKDVQSKLCMKKKHRINLSTYWSTLLNTRQTAVHPRPTYRRISKIVKTECEHPCCDAPLVDERKRPYNKSMADDFPKVLNRYGKPIGVTCKMVDCCPEIHRLPTEKTCWVCAPSDKDVFTTTCCNSTMCKDHIPLEKGRKASEFACPKCNTIISKDKDLVLWKQGWFNGFDHEPIPEEFQHWYASSKINVAIDTLETILNDNPEEKVVIFSQWTEILDLVSQGCQSRGINPLRLDGSTSRRQRDRQLEDFRENDKQRVFLASLGSSGEGLNLFRGNHVILVDPWWNPSIEKQAVARLHRIGQKRKVTIYRLLASGSIEERLLRIQAFKNKMVSTLLKRGKHDENPVQEFHEDEILYLLGMAENDARWKNEPLGLVDTAEKSTAYVSVQVSKELRRLHAGVKIPESRGELLETISEDPDMSE